MVNRDSKDKAKDVEATLTNDNINVHKQQQQQLLSNSSSKTMLAQQETVHNNKNQNDMICCVKKKWVILLSMTVTLLITATLVAMLTVSLLDNEDQCFTNFPFQQPSYKLFATKTAYSTSYNYLNLSTSRQNYDKNSLQLPNIFSKLDTLKTLNDRLTSKESGCKVRQLHYFGRHAARYPSSKAIQEINQLLNNVQNRIDLSKFSLSNNNSNGNKSCFNPLAQYKQWVSFMNSAQGNLLMNSGIEETSAIAQRFKSIFPQMFNTSQSKIEFGTTEELRTAQTALVFLKQIENFPLGFCSLDQFPNDNASDQSKADEIKSNECYKTFVKKNFREKLQFHKRCDSFNKEEFQIRYGLNLKEPNRTKSIAVSVSKKLKLFKDDQLSNDETDALYKLCKFETAFTGASIWCNLFSDSDLKFYEYLNDVDDFFNQAYGHPDQMRSACPVTTDLMKAFRVAMGQDSSKDQPEAHFYFTHSEVLQKIIAASVDLEQDPEYSRKNILANFQAGTSPESRQWQTSLFTPFSANLAFTLYECPKNNKNSGDFAEIDLSAQSPFKVVASLNEQPILLDGCSNYVCDMKELETDSRINKEKRCKLEDICKKKIVID